MNAVSPIHEALHIVAYYGTIAAYCGAAITVVVLALLAIGSTLSDRR